MEPQHNDFGRAPTESEAPWPSGLPRGRRVWTVNLILVTLVAISFWLIAHRDLAWTFQTGDEREYAELGRRIAQGRGFTSGIIYPSQIRWGVNEEHPSLVRAPGWPLVIAAIFKITGPSESAVHLATLACFAATAVLVFALGAALAGPWLGLVAGLASATNPDVLVYALFTGTETPFAMCIALVFLLIVRDRSPFSIGIACGLGYLTRYNGGLLLPMAVALMLAKGPLDWKPLFRNAVRYSLLCGLGFAILAVPWWIRNAIVTGEPFYSLYGLTLYYTTHLSAQNASLNHMLVPDLTSAAAMDPWLKFQVVMPKAIAHWPLATANLAACVGLLLGCLRRDRNSLALIGITGITTILIAFMLLRGRYLIPFVPVMLAIGAACWLRYGGVLRVPALVLILLAPLLPTIPSSLYDTQLAHNAIAAARARLEEEPGFAARMAPCMADRPLVIAQNGAAVTWAADNVTIHMTRTEEDFWQLVERYPVAVVRLAPKHRLQTKPEFLERFAPARECGAGVYRRRDRWIRPAPRFGSPPAGAQWADRRSFANR